MTEFIELSLVAEEPHCGQIEVVLLEAGACSITIEGNEREICLEGDPGSRSWTVRKVSALFDRNILSTGTLNRIESGLGAFPIRGSLKVTDLPDLDWEQAWQDHVRPVVVEDRLWIGPTWAEPDGRYDTEIRINPGLAFGTGGHETTFLCLQALAGASLDGKTVIDFGCGSGVLGIAACLMGASRCIGVDIDPDAVGVANENARINGVQDRFEALSNGEFAVCRDPGREGAQVVVANILAGALIDLADVLTDIVSDDGMLILSGVLPDQVESVLDAYEGGFRFESSRLGDWVMLAGSACSDADDKQVDTGQAG